MGPEGKLELRGKFWGLEESLGPYGALGSFTKVLSLKLNFGFGRHVWCLKEHLGTCKFGFVGHSWHYMAIVVFRQTVGSGCKVGSWKLWRSLRL